MPACSEVFRDGLLDGRVALVTGGGTGLGLAAAAELARCGARVAIAGRRRGGARVGRRRRSARARSPSPATSATRSTPDAILDTVLEAHGRLDVLVNNAGGQYWVPAEAIEPKGWRAVHRLNVGGTERMTRLAFERVFAPQGAGTVAQRDAAPAPRPGGHDALQRRPRGGRGLHAAPSPTEWAPHGVTVIALAAGHYLTDAVSKYPDVVKAQAAASVPLGRLGRPEEHAWLVALCASRLGRALSGSVVTLDGARDDWYGPWPRKRCRAGRGPHRGAPPVDSRSSSSGRSVVAAQKPSKLLGRVRFPSPAPRTHSSGSGAVW